MHTGVKLGAYGAVLAVAFGGAWGVGAIVGPSRGGPLAPGMAFTGHEHPGESMSPPAGLAPSLAETPPQRDLAAPRPAEANSPATPPSSDAPEQFLATPSATDHVGTDPAQPPVNASDTTADGEATATRNEPRGKAKGHDSGIPGKAHGRQEGGRR